MVKDRHDANGNCCFQNADEFLVFLPDTLGDFFLSENTAEIKCITDTLEHSTVLASYYNSSKHLVTVRITEYCTSREILATDYTLKQDRGKSEFNEFHVPGSHHGFSSYDSKEEEAAVVLVVDNRFLVEVRDMVTPNSKNALLVYEKLPLKELSAFRK